MKTPGGGEVKAARGQEVSWFINPAKMDDRQKNPGVGTVCIECSKLESLYNSVINILLAILEQ